jgi:hypothetical protein
MVGLSGESEEGKERKRKEKKGKMTSDVGIEVGRSECGKGGGERGTNGGIEKGTNVS